MKKEYNKLIANILKGEKFIEEHSKDENIMIYMTKFRKALDKANELIKKLQEKLGREMTDNEVLNGFKEE